MFSFKKKRKITKWLLIAVAIFFIIVSSIGACYKIFEIQHQNRFYPGIFIGTVNVGGLSKNQAKEFLNRKIDKIKQNGIVFKFGNHQTNLFPVIASLETDLAYEIITFNIDKVIDEAFEHGRRGNFLARFNSKRDTYFNKIYYKVDYAANQEEISKFLKTNFSQYEKPAKDASLSYNHEENVFEISDEQIGQIVNYDDAVMQLNTILSTLSKSQVILKSQIDTPEVFKSDCLSVKSKATVALSDSPIILNFEEKKWTVKKAIIADWLIMKSFSKDKDEIKIKIGFNHETIVEYLKKNISDKINIEPVDAKFEIKDGKVLKFQQSKDGLELLLEESAKRIEEEFIKNRQNKIELVTKEWKSKIQTEEINDLGIKEILGVGHSNFAGSPKNRRENIRIGSEAVNGVLIKPNEEFSLINALGEINGEAGYLPELVIKNNKTIAEYGGGLCQIGTTLFRATYKSGLPVTLRRNHSYRVSYYEPAGTDATIYDPWPDYRFKNDTEKHILIQSSIEGDDIYFTFWGTNDGRIASNTEPVITNITKPEPTKIIKTTELKPGVKKCTESAHNGADAYFDYQVKYPDGTYVDTKFESHYVPWRAVCFLGVEKLEEEKNDGCDEEECGEGEVCEKEKPEEE